jgi:hypothetical protein
MVPAFDDMNIYIYIGKQYPEIWRLFSIVSKKFSEIFNRQIFDQYFPGIWTNDFVHRFKNSNCVFCLCKKTMRYVGGADPDSLYLTRSSRDVISAMPFYSGPRNIQLTAEGEVVTFTLPSTKPEAPFTDTTLRQRYERRNQPQNFNKRR